MRSTFCVFVFCSVLRVAAYGQDASKPITHREACELFTKAVVQVDTAVTHGTGFVADSNGYIVTAFHVVADMQTLRGYGNLTVSFEHGDQSIPTEIVSPIDALSRARDFAVLKINKSKLFSLTLGNEDDAAIGAKITIIGLPLSASFPISIGAVPHFCLTGTMAAQTSFPIGERNHLDTFYFQGISIKGISGAPIILLDTGKVIGVANTRMTGISRELSELHNQIAAGKGKNAMVSNLEPGTEIDKIITVLDQQLANGLGTGTGVADIAYALKKANRDYEKQHPTK